MCQISLQSVEKRRPHVGHVGLLVKRNTDVQYVFFSPQVHSPNHASDFNVLWLKRRGLVQGRAFSGSGWWQFIFWGLQPQNLQYLASVEKSQLKLNNFLTVRYTPIGLVVGLMYD